MEEQQELLRLCAKGNRELLKLRETCWEDCDMSEKFVLATHNPGKLKEMSAILAELGIQVVGPDELGDRCGGGGGRDHLCGKRHAQGPGHLCAASGLPAIADDSGLCVDALNGGPGVYSARYGGEGLDDRGRTMLLLQNMRGQTTRAAHFACAICCVFPSGDTLTAEGRCEGAIAFAPMGEGGFAAMTRCSWCRRRPRLSPS